MEIEKQLLQLHIRNALLMQQIYMLSTEKNNLIDKLNQVIEQSNENYQRLYEKVPKKHEIERYVDDKLKQKMKIFDDCRVSAIKHLSRLNEKAEEIG